MKKYNDFIDPYSNHNLIVNKDGLFNQTTKTLYPFINQCVDFRKNVKSIEWFDYYQENASTYDDFNDLTFKLQGYDEMQVRKYSISKLGNISGKKLLEIGSGTGRDSSLIEKSFGNKGEFYLLDASDEMLKVCKSKLNNQGVNKHFVLADANFLPFKDNTFDFIYSFVTLPAIGDKSKFLNEISRVLKPDGKVVLGSEGILPSIKNTEFGKILTSNSLLYNQKVPFEHLPKNISNVSIEWIVNDIIFLLSFKKLRAPRKIEDIIIPGKRGGTLYSRYYGKTEGLSLETKKTVENAMKESKLSYYDWLNTCIIEAAKKELNE